MINSSAIISHSKVLHLINQVIRLVMMIHLQDLHFLSVTK
ncbi:hypothetical protein OENI_10058 [Oenococcus oeni]|uniref:Uncharacterized protein n=1 Tax=Oenococcus oeni TaxID=1247 RepID=A0AAQ2URW2_OENOE|nr:hypothetical protein OENI_10088 [Oenococcus oeni]SYV99240.1 hypothetical protein OENI_1170023 [Oenococcus oeni]SYW00356.1 hypothetical protein OENI_10058 [Oenococcus oeni]SYW07141.1 hypothetical protein OENI_10037 [Oenococcus oeni]SYW07445.1 hypothetical protein OENI_70029 [Oenococcus oeni]